MKNHLLETFQKMFHSPQLTYVNIYWCVKPCEGLAYGEARRRCVCEGPFLGRREVGLRDTRAWWILQQNPFLVGSHHMDGSQRNLQIPSLPTLPLPIIQDKWPEGYPFHYRPLHKLCHGSEVEFLAATIPLGQAWGRNAHSTWYMIDHRHGRIEHLEEEERKKKYLWIAL